MCGPRGRFFLIAGPTAVGKSEIAMAVAERCGGEIVGADALQIYAGVPILTAQPSAADRARVPHHLVGEIPLTESFDLAQFVARADARIGEIRARGRVPIICGGTGLYLRSLLCGLADLPGADQALRAELEAQPLAMLQQRLRELDPHGAQQVDLRNPRRVIRAVEVCLLTGRPFSSFRHEWRRVAGLARGVVLTRERDELNRRIDARTEAMFATGVEDEVRQLTDVGATAFQAIGFGQVKRYLAGELTRAQCFTLIQQATRQYAKRQRTWFRRELALVEVDLSASPDYDQLISELSRQATETQTAS